MKPRIILSARKFKLTLDRLCYQLLENHRDFADTILVGIQPRGIRLAEKIHRQLVQSSGQDIESGIIDPTFYRDDYRSGDKQLTPTTMAMPVSLEGKRVVLIDDVLFSGRTVRAAMDALLDFGRPSKVELLVLIDRRFSRDLPIQADYVGKTIDSLTSEKVKVEWGKTEDEDCIWILPKHAEV